MATASARPQTARPPQDARGRPSRPRSVEEAIADVLLRLTAVVAVLGACLVALPVWGVALLVAYGYRLVAGQVRYGWQWLPRLDLAALAAVGPLAAWRLGLGPAAWLELQAGAGGAFWAGATLPGGMPAEQLAVFARGWAGAVWPYALAWGAPAGAVLAVADRLHRFHSVAIPGGETERTKLKFHDLGRLAEGKGRRVAWALPRVIGRGVVTLLSAPPGLGKGYWLQGFVRAMQDGEPFYGLPTRRLGRVLWCTEEGPSVEDTARRFGIKRGQVTILRREELRGWDWPELVREVRRQAWRRGCAIVVFDTVRAWCPEAEQSNAQAAEVMNLARAELAGHGLAVVFVHHDTKAGGEYGEQVAGPNNLVGSCDVLVSLQRVRGQETARRMLVSRRFGDQDRTARLEGHRYVAPAAARAAVQEAVHRGELAPARQYVCATPGCGKPASEWHHPSYAPGQELAVAALCQDCHQRETTDLAATLRETVRTVRAAGGAMTTDDFIKALGVSPATASRRLTAAEAAGLLTREGTGGRSGPQVWRVVAGGTGDGT
jgi:AAA domain